MRSYYSATGRSPALAPGFDSRLIVGRPTGVAVKVISRRSTVFNSSLRRVQSDTMVELSPQTQSNNWQKKLGGGGDISTAAAEPFVRSAEWKENAH